MAEGRPLLCTLECNTAYNYVHCMCKAARVLSHNATKSKKAKRE